MLEGCREIGATRSGNQRRRLQRDGLPGEVDLRIQAIKGLAPQRAVLGVRGDGTAGFAHRAVHVGVGHQGPGKIAIRLAGQDHQVSQIGIANDQVGGERLAGRKGPIAHSGLAGE